MPNTVVGQCWWSDSRRDFLIDSIFECGDFWIKEYVEYFVDGLMLKIFHTALLYAKQNFIIPRPVLEEAPYLDEIIQSGLIIEVYGGDFYVPGSWKYGDNWRNYLMGFDRVSS